MSMKSWVLHRVQGINDAAGRPDLAPREAGTSREPTIGGRGAGAAGPQGSEPVLPRADHRRRA
jgi:hypothetical protein